ncbi:MAG TPA: endonuclease III [Clostridia bacterium]|jgi:endonuclease-3|nr:endonuclease III [Clostridia bacterium]
MNAVKILEKLKTIYPNAGCELKYSSPFELLVAVILSAQCTDKRVNIITEDLFKIYNKPEQFAELSLKELTPLIYSCGFFNNKGKNIIEMSKQLVKFHNSEVPIDMDKLLSLPGVGRKTASVVRSVAFNLPAMPVDTHVYRVSKRIGFSDGDTVDDVERDLCKLFDMKYWNDVHHTLIFHGRYLCKAQNPKCEECIIKSVCKHYNLNK